jgi:hypothetical protein
VIIIIPKKYTHHFEPDQRQSGVLFEHFHGRVVAGFFAHNVNLEARLSAEWNAESLKSHRCINTLGRKQNIHFRITPRSRPLFAKSSARESVELKFQYGTSEAGCLSDYICGCTLVFSSSRSRLYNINASQLYLAAPKFEYESQQRYRRGRCVYGVRKQTE